MARGEEFRMRIHSRDNERCVYCGIELSLDEMTIDHVVPVTTLLNSNAPNIGQPKKGKKRHRGELRDYNNMVCCCKSCNNLKNHSTLDGFRQTMQRRNNTSGMHLFYFEQQLLMH